MQQINAIHSRIIELYAVRIGLTAAELEYQTFINRFWLSGAEVLTLVFGAAAVGTKNWGFGVVGILGLALTLGLLARRFWLRHRFFQAVSAELQYRVSARHPVRGLPNWRKKLSEERTKQLDAQFNAWCEARGIANRINPIDR